MVSTSKPTDSTVKRRKGMQALGGPITKLTRQTFGERGLADGAIVNNWATIAGDMLASASLPEKIAYVAGQKGRGTLHLRVANSGLATEIQHLEPLLLERVNSYFGYQAVARLKLIHGPLPPPAKGKAFELQPLSDEQTRALAGDLVNVDDPDLKAALEKLGQSVIGRRVNTAK